MPAVCFLVWLFRLNELAVGLILVSCCPGGSGSSFVVFCYNVVFQLV